MSLSLNISSALNLELEGSTGSFSVGRGGQNTIDVKYFLTHVGLDFDTAANVGQLSVECRLPGVLAYILVFYQAFR